MAFKIVERNTGLDVWNVIDKDILRINGCGIGFLREA